MVQTTSSAGITRHTSDLRIDLFFEYHQAQALIDRIGPITADPVSKRPIENPYVRIRDAAARKMDSYRTLRVDALWQAAWQIEHGKKA